MNNGIPGEARGPARRFLTAEWRDLVLLNYAIEPAILARRVPPGTELDEWQGRTLVSLVGFRFLDTRVLGAPVPFHRHFEEVNLRFYVRRRQAAEWKRGVVFVKEIVPRRAIAWVARTLYHENYVAMPMRHRVSLPAPAPGEPEGAGEGSVAYGWRCGGRWHRVAATVRGAPSLPAAGSEAEFITEHYWGYALQPDGSALEYQVEHPQWQVWPAVSAHLGSDRTGETGEGDGSDEIDVAAFGRLYGPRIAQALTAPPVSAFVAAGSAIAVRRGLRLPAT